MATALLWLRGCRAAVIVVLVVLAARYVAIAGEHTDNPVPQMGRVAKDALAAIERSGGLPGVKTIYFVAVPTFDQWAFQFSAMMQFYYPSLDRVIYASDPARCAGRSVAPSSSGDPAGLQRQGDQTHEPVAIRSRAARKDLDSWTASGARSGRDLAADDRGHFGAEQFDRAHDLVVRHRADRQLK